MKQLRTGLSQINPSVGDIPGNTKKIIQAIEAARDLDIDILCFPELAVTGYPPEDLLLKTEFIDDNIRALDEIKQRCPDNMIVIVGFVDKKDDIFNSAAVIQGTELVDVYNKLRLPNYGVFDENRYFLSERRSPVYSMGKMTFGVTICEDIWYPGEPIRSQVLLGNAQIIFNLSASPYYMGKPLARERMLATRAVDYNTIIAYCNMVGGQDELVFDGNSMFIDEKGKIVATAQNFEEDLLVCDVNTEKVYKSRLNTPTIRKTRYELSFEENQLQTFTLKPAKAKRKVKIPETITVTPRDPLKAAFSALVLGTGDYIRKNGFKKVVVGLSGGIDSSLTAVVAAEAIGPSKVVGVSMPSVYSSEGSITDAEKLANNLGIELLRIPIEDAFTCYKEIFVELFSGREDDVTEENIQARIRGNILMALSNKFGWLVLATSNKSELAVGYSTLYGDMSGGFAVIKDVPKTMVYELSHYYNSLRREEIIPKSVIEKAPSAELRPGQRDTDSLPEYDTLDRILKAYVEDGLGVDDIAKLGEKKSVVRKIIRMVNTNEYKRRQSAPGVKITSLAFGKDRRFPITNLYKR
ncbi:MAG: NAD+ synthase [Candidatus Dadabacteria bacterium]|nr:NAD+ synthase [Candidatus Dadabacteria bacterium]